MNLLLIKPEDIISDMTIIRDKKKIAHVINVLKKTVSGDKIKIGILNSYTGTGEITYIDENKIELKVSVCENPPAPLPMKLIIAMPRPKVFRKILQHGTSLGIKEFHFMRTWKTDKSYLLSPVLEEKKIYKDLITGLEQAKDTILPSVFIHPLFKPFVEDKLPAISMNTLRIAAHPGEKEFIFKKENSAYTIAIGPEGGFTDYEIKLLETVGFIPACFGQRILRVETALPFIAGRLFHTNDMQ